MLAAEIWHWWIGVLLTWSRVLAVVALVGGYLKHVTVAALPQRSASRDD